MVQTYTGIAFLRAIAAFWVLLGHCMIWGGWYGIPLPSAKIAVDLFMMLSGFLMVATSDARDDTEPLAYVANWRRFWLRRFFRLAPLYYFVLTLAIITRDSFTGGYHALQVISPAIWGNATVYDPTTIHYSLTNVLLHVSFLSGLFPAYVNASFLPDWSLSLEMQFYLIFPALLLLMRRFGVARSALVVGGVSILLGRLIAARVAYQEPSLLLFKLQYFIAGMLISRALQDVPRWHALRLLACALVLVSLEFRYGRDLLILPGLAGTIALLGWLESTGRMPGWLAAILGSRVVGFASDTSYGVYLLHGFFLSASGLIIIQSAWLLALSPPVRVLCILLFVTLLVYPAAFVTYRLIEQPGIHLGSRLIRRIAPAARAAAPVPAVASAAPRS